MAGPNNVTFTDVGTEGIPPNLVFTVSVNVAGKEFTGKGPNKKKAKADAATIALKNLYNIDSVISNLSSVKLSNGAGDPGVELKATVKKSACGILHEKDPLKDADGKAKGHTFVEKPTKGEAPNLTIVMSVLVKNRNFVGEGKSKKDAKNAAAEKALK